MQSSKEQIFAKELINFIDSSPSSFHVVENIKELLLKNKFLELQPSGNWDIKKQGKYFTTINGTTIAIIKIGKKDISETGFRMITAHTDSPTFRIKPNPEIISEKNYLKLNIEPYGGAILNTWFDRPLSLAGRVLLKGKSLFFPKTKLIDFEQPFLIIPNLAIHLNREVNEGVKIHKQFHIQPLMSIVEENFKKENFLNNLISEKLEIEKSQILDYDLFLYETQNGEIIGLNEDLISSGKLDNLSMVHAGLEAIIKSEVNDTTSITVFFDNEEVGSKTKQGAGSPFIRNLLERLIISLENKADSYYKSLHKSFIISADMAHAVHPNYPEMHDQTCRPIINNGPVIKLNANQKYTTDGESSAIFEALCQKAEVPVQKYVNRSDLAGGSTLGNVLTSQFEIRSVDVGNPMLAMHSIRELCGVKDHFYIKKVFELFLNL